MPERAIEPPTDTRWRIALTGDPVRLARLRADAEDAYQRYLDAYQRVLDAENEGIKSWEGDEDVE